MPPLKPPLDIAEAKAIMAGGLGRAELELVTGFCAPLYWVENEGGRNICRNGTAFFLDAGRGPFGVTAAHVVKEWQDAKTSKSAGPLRLGGKGTSLPFQWNDREIDIHPGMDIATFSVTPGEVAKLGKTILTGSQASWPPGPPQEQRGIYYCGYPGVGTREISTQEVSFGAVPGGGIASSVSEKDISTLIEREHLMPVMGGELPPENFNFGGISGGLMLTVIENKGLRTWAMSGVIYEGPNPTGNPDEAIAGLEIIRARRAHFILEDGRLNTALWHSLA